MSFIQIASFIVIFVFYISFCVKMLLQKQKGIRTHQVGRGNKPAQTRLVEKFMSAATTAVVLCEVISIIFDWRFFECFPMELCGLIIAACGVAIFIIAMKTMRDSWRAGINKDERTELVTSGIYKFSRNPAFLGFDLTYIGLLLAFFNIALIFFTIFAIVMLHFQILEEEKYLTQAFTDYKEYKNKVGRYLLYI